MEALTTEKCNTEYMYLESVQKCLLEYKFYIEKTKTYVILVKNVVFLIISC
jgi:hypothetical protein